MIKKILLLLVALPSLVKAQTSTNINPILAQGNQPIAFDKFNALVIKDAVYSSITDCNRRIKAITAIPAGHQTVANTLMAFDNINYTLGDVSNKVFLVTATYTDDKTRDEANSQIEKLSSFSSDLYLNEGLYNALKKFANSSVAKKLNQQQKKFLKETLVSFEVNGMKLDANERKQLKAINNKLIAFGVQFDKNISEYKDSATFTEAQLKGVPDKTKAAWKKADGIYVVIVNGPNSSNILKYADDEQTRHQMYLKYINRGYPANINVLDSLFSYRQKLATTLGYKTYAEYALVQKMAKNPATVWHFLDDLRDKLSPNVMPETNELSAVKHKLHPELTDTIYAWDNSYYVKKTLDSKYQLNTDELKEYFEMNSTVMGMFNLYQKLFNIDIREVKGLPVWCVKVKSYELYKDGQKMGTFFLDLYPRPNKYTHFATAPISYYHLGVNGKETLPVATLICNFPEETTTEPSLMNHGDVITMFHEFGHLIHFLLSHPVITSQNPFAGKGDFVEAPSQFMENFCWNYNCLKLFAHNYKTGAVLPVELFNKMKKAQLFNISNQYITQVYYATLDFTYEDRYNIVKEKGVDRIATDLYAITQHPYPQGSHMICSFTHLNGYGANAYGYLWSKVFAQDMFSVFEQNGVLNQQLGIKYRKGILEKGATEEEVTLLRKFLGRQPNSRAFLKSLGLK